MKKGRRFKKKVRLYNVAIVLCIIITGISLVIAIKPDIMSKVSAKISNWWTNITTKEEKYETYETNKIEESNKIVTTEMTEEEARKMAVKKFKELGENVKENELKVYDIKRDGEISFYIVSEKNTMEIRKRDGKVTRLNANIVN